MVGESSFAFDDQIKLFGGELSLAALLGGI